MKKVIAIILVLCLVIGAVALFGKDSGSSAESPKAVTLVLDYVPNTNHTGFYVARALGYYEEAGLDVTIIEPGDNDAATLCAKYEIVPAAPIAEKAIPHCNITFVSGSEMKNSIIGYFEVLKSFDPTSIGGALPDDSFYYGAK